jgi:hypothetical protein
LERASRAFINDERRNRMTSEFLELSKIFSWFRGDFEEGQELRGFIDRYSVVDLDEEV